jgi:hypothetical protein
VTQGVDEAVDLVTSQVRESFLAPGEGRQIRNKIDWLILPLLFAIYIGISQNSIFNNLYCLLTAM